MKRIVWELRKKAILKYKEIWYEQYQELTAENEDVKLLWNMNRQCFDVFRHSFKAGKSYIIVDIAASADGRVY